MFWITSLDSIVKLSANGLGYTIVFFITSATTGLLIAIFLRFVGLPSELCTENQFAPRFSGKEASPNSIVEKSTA
ncbi:hypothetical protein D3C85_887880 [compost metagenome]